MARMEKLMRRAQKHKDNPKKVRMYARRIVALERQFQLQEYFLKWQRDFWDAMQESLKGEENDTGTDREA